ncbi:FixH family protein [Maribacter sp. ACAM166]|uniref:FixH family protein n=1 Tax=Maribacter sp. ACAM166 TaxID=2508996 RepID=UPI0010FEB076|nr:FixH family protein [Maribacter sp. ACAM166]TLP80308.1 FixH family protein [Maribacter sp. ACAM166]
MKINWGTAIVIAFIGFISFILFFVIRMSTNHRAHHDLVTEDYYRAELAFQDEIDDQNNATKNSVNLTVLKQEAGLLVQFPSNLNYSKVKGTVSLYRPSNKKLDFDIDLKLTSAQILIPDNRLLDGRWDVKVSWKYENESYLFKDKITY